MKGFSLFNTLVAFIVIGCSTIKKNTTLDHHKISIKKEIAMSKQEKEAYGETLTTSGVLQYECKGNIHTIKGLNIQNNGAVKIIDCNILDSKIKAKTLSIVYTDNYIKKGLEDIHISNSSFMNVEKLTIQSNFSKSEFNGSFLISKLSTKKIRELRIENVDQIINSQFVNANIVKISCPEKFTSHGDAIINQSLSLLKNSEFSSIDKLEINNCQVDGIESYSGNFTYLPGKASLNNRILRSKIYASKFVNLSKLSTLQNTSIETKNLNIKGLESYDCIIQDSKLLVGNQLQIEYSNIVRSNLKSKQIVAQDFHLINNATINASSLVLEGELANIKQSKFQVKHSIHIKDVESLSESTLFSKNIIMIQDFTKISNVDASARVVLVQNGRSLASTNIDFVERLIIKEVEKEEEVAKDQVSGL
ncbi:MAG: hypothetical protein HOE90_03260 [Bacteriovoracaceae bacterium]|jgi:hypothetical protein|nr:hypothetical protein [Bacteriovoracaceae bacterium]